MQIKKQVLAIIPISTSMVELKFHLVNQKTQKGRHKKTRNVCSKKAPTFGANYHFSNDKDFYKFLLSMSNGRASYFVCGLVNDWI